MAWLWATLDQPLAALVIFVALAGTLHTVIVLLLLRQQARVRRLGRLRRPGGPL
jgi:Flp pilus assembly protein protease CpaA